MISGIKLCNSLPDELEKENSISTFKNTLKRYFIDSYSSIDFFEVLL